MIRILLVISIVCAFSTGALAWEKRGHEIVASVAARLLEEKQHREFLRNHEFDLGYYSNVPDIIWRGLGKEIGEREGPQHYIDWNGTFEKIFGAPKNLPPTFEEFKAKMGDAYNFKNGVVPYRIHDMVARCKKIVETLNKDTEGPLLVCMGTLSHYTGDLSMPLHTTDNHDGQMTHQEGIHGYFEGVLVDALDPELKVEVLEKAEKLFDQHVTKNMSSDAAVRWLISDSYGKVSELLNLDHGLNRKDINAAKKKYHSLIVSRLAEGAVVTAEVWSEILTGVKDWDNYKLYFFDGKPDWVDPGHDE